MEKDNIYKQLLEIAPSFESKFEYQSDSKYRIYGVIFQFANEQGGIGDYEERYISNNSSENNAEIFYKLARFLEDYEVETYIDYNFDRAEHKAIGKVLQFDTQLDYRWLKKEDLYCYLSWRTALRKILSVNIKELSDDNKEMKYLNKTSNDLYMRLYLLEIINLIGIRSVEEGNEILTKKIPELFSNFNEVLEYTTITNAYCLYYGINDGTINNKKIDADIIKLRNGKYLDLIPFFKKNTAYNYITSSFYSTEWGYLMLEILPYVCAGINKHMRSKGVDFIILLTGDFQKDSYWTPFKSMNFLEQGKANPICDFQSEYQRSYSYEDGKWARYDWWNSTFAKAVIGYLMKITEKNLREYYRQNSRITVNLDRFLETDVYAKENHKEIFNKFREEIYSKESQDLIRNIVHTYIKKKVQ